MQFWQIKMQPSAYPVIRNWCSRSRRGKRALSFRPAKQAFHRRKRHFGVCHPAKTAFHRMELYRKGN